MAKISLLPALDAPDGTELVPVVKDGKTWGASLAALSTGLIVPQGVATVAGNTPTATEYTVTIPAGFEPFANRAIVEFVVPEDSLGLIFVTIGSVPIRELFMPIGQQLRRGWTARVEKNDGGDRWNLVRQTPDGVTFLAAESKANAAYTALSAAIGVQFAEPILGNPNEVSVPNAPLVNDAAFEMIITKTNTAALVITNGSGERRAIVGGDAGVFQKNTIAKIQYSGGFSNYVYIGSRDLPNLDTVSGLMSAIVGIPLARPIDGNPNEVFIEDAPLINDFSFEVVITKTNTGDLIVTNGSGERRAVVGGGAGVFPAFTIAKIQYSAGYDNYVFVSSRPLPGLGDTQAAANIVDLWSGFDHTLTAPYGDVVQGPDGKPVFSPRVKRLVGRGSSVVTDSDPEVNRDGAAPIGQAPLTVLADALSAAHGPGTLYRADGWSHGGHVQSQAEGQWAEAMAVDPSPVFLLFDGFGMNDMQMSAYNSGQISPVYFSSPLYYEAEIKRRLDGGVQYYVACTSPHDNTDQQTNTFGGNALQWPYAKAAPIADDELVPPYNADPALNRSITPLKDWTGRGILRRGNARGEHVNELIRNTLRRLHNDPKYRGRVFLLDVEWAWFRYGVEQHSLDALFGDEIVHPQLLGHQVSYQRCIREFVAASRRGFGDQWCFRGERAGSLQPPVFIQPTQPDHAGPYAWWDTSGGDISLSIEDGQ
ncbi:hypothetical protein [Sphingomonas faeni]|uniref:hypothetical protein n=1 Tax=Sphingomonas faeni TaxID=185950 RepID=UPI0020C79201|nr:hypothetical protein [Sphingomonas faeni]MCP8892999.1 hypothetical protein [Sphingomonas faeni]